MSLPGPPTVPPGEELAQEGGYRAALDAYDRALLAAVLAQANGSIREAARVAGLSRNGFRAKLRRLGL